MQNETSVLKRDAMKYEMSSLFGSCWVAVEAGNREEPRCWVMMQNFECEGIGRTDLQPPLLY